MSKLFIHHSIVVYNFLCLYTGLSDNVVGHPDIVRPRKFYINTDYILHTA